MNQRNREMKRKLSKRKNFLIGLLVFFIAVIIIAGYWRASQKQILENEQYTDPVSTELYFFKDCGFMELDGFKASDLSCTAGTKMSSYQTLTNSQMTISSDYVQTRISTIDSLISGHYYEDWNQLASGMDNTFTSIGGLDKDKSNQKSFLLQAAQYCGQTQAALQSEKTTLASLNTSTAADVTLQKLGMMNTGYVYPYITQYEQGASEAVLGQLSLNLLKDMDALSSEQTAGIKVVSNDHLYAVCVVSSDVDVQGEDSMQKLKDKNASGLSDEDYYDYLVSRVDMLRQYPELSFEYNRKSYSAYLVNTKTEDNKKILVLMIKDYIHDFLQDDKHTASLNVQSFNAWVLPQSAIIRQDGKTYVQSIEKGYFKEQVEVKVNRYDSGKAILKVSENDSLKNGLSIKIFP
ncbi:MAG: hypothetical protein ACOYB8_08295 [Eubacteriaceae bacterium]|jgi:hypothetical protein